MARDRNVTVWQAYVTVMSIVSFICLGALAYMMFTSGTNFKTAQTAQKEKQDAENNLRKITQKNQLLQSILGVGKPISEAEFTQLKSTSAGEADIDAAVKTYTNHMSLFGPNEAEKNYAKLVDTLMQELRSRNIQLAQAATKAEADTKTFEEKLKAETDLRLQAQAETDKVTRKAAQDLAEYTQKNGEQAKLIQKVEQEKTEQVNLYKKQKVAETEKLVSANKQNGELVRRIDSLVSKINEFQNESFQYVQGEITDVASRNDGREEVWINLGRSDGLRPGVTFVVVDADTVQATQAKRKATIEVVEVVSGTGHLSRAKVMPDKGFTTILRGDKIYSPFWQPGSVVEVALVGKIDVDGDGIDDRNKLESLIEQNGLKIAMDVSPSGEVKGKLNEHVRWMVMGTDLSLQTDEEGQLDPAVVALGKQRRQLELEARQFGITIIPPVKFMNLIRVGSDVSPLGSAARPDITDYRRAAPQSSNGRVSNLYQRKDGRLRSNNDDE